MLGALFGVVGGIGFVLILSSFFEFPSAQDLVQAIRSWPYAWIGICVAIAVARVSGWWAWGACIGVLIALIPRFRQDMAGERAFADKTDAVASWAESLRDAMSGSHGVQGALLSVAPSAPPVIRQDALLMAEEIVMGVPMADGLADFARRVDNPVSDLVCAVMAHAVRHSASEVPEMLESIAATARERARAHAQIEASRAKPKRTVQLSALLIVVLAGLILTMMRGLIEPLISPSGQIPVTIATTMVVGAFIWMSQLAKVRRPLRLLDLDAEFGTVQ